MAEQTITPTTQLFDSLDHMAHLGIARTTKGLAPATMATAWMDWACHWLTSPGTQARHWQKAFQQHGSAWLHFLGMEDAGQLSSRMDRSDARFRSEGWALPPFNLLKAQFLAQENLWLDAINDVRGVNPRHAAALSFAVRQALDICSPSNFLLTNPDVGQRVARTGGRNLLDGALNLAEDLAAQRFLGAPAEQAPRVGHELAATAGKVVYRNHLMELIQYEPTTDQVRPEPVMIVPAWIMKYYILDLRPENSLIRHLVDQGYTVFALSWRNPGAEERDYGMDDYRRLGPMAALDAIQAITGASRVHAAGYCLGGTLLCIAAATMARDQGARLASLTLFAAQADFSEPGELMLFISEGQVALLEDMMREQGYLEPGQMSGAFTLLRANDLLWSRLVREYLLGERPVSNDLMSWNADTTRLPYRMHSEYLRRLYLENQLAEGRYPIDGQPVSLTDIRVPLFAVGTETDHVAPWQSVFKIQRLTETETTFVLTNGGHNAGIVSAPGRANRHFRIATTERDAPYLSPEAWFERNEPQDGSWWTGWVSWLDARSGEPKPPPPLGNPDAGYAPLADAPGSYVFQS